MVGAVQGRGTPFCRTSGAAIPRARVGQAFVWPFPAQARRIPRFAAAAVGEGLALAGDAGWRTGADSPCRVRAAAVPGLSVAQWVRLARPFSLPASVVPVLVGAAAAAERGPVSPARTALMLAVALLLQAATNMANEYCDHRSGVDGPSSIGIAGVLVTGEAAPAAVRRAFLVTYGLALLAGIALAALRGWVLVPVGLLMIAVSYLYSGGPHPISRTPWGEVCVFLAMGPLEVMISEFASGAGVTRAALAAALPVGCTVAAVLLGNNLRDLANDVEHGRRTLAAVLGADRSARLLLVLLAAGVASAPVLAGVGILPAPTAWTLLVVPAMLPLWRQIGRARRGAWSANLVPALARLHLYGGALLAAGLLAGRWV